MTPYSLRPAFEVVRGRVVSISGQSTPVVSGGGIVLAGTGAVKVETDVHESHEFWLRDKDGNDHQFQMGSTPFPPMLLDHAVTVVLAGDSICAIANHSTGRQLIYPSAAGHRDLGAETGNYDRQSVQIVVWAVTFLLFVAGCAFGPVGLLGAALFCALMWGIVGLALRRQDRTQQQINTHNLAIDREIERLIAIPK